MRSAIDLIADPHISQHKTAVNHRNNVSVGYRDYSTNKARFDSSLLRLSRPHGAEALFLLGDGVIGTEGETTMNLAVSCACVQMDRYKAATGNEVYFALGNHDIDDRYGGGSTTDNAKSFYDELINTAVHTSYNPDNLIGSAGREYRFYYALDSRNGAFRFIVLDSNRAYEEDSYDDSGYYRAGDTNNGHSGEEDAGACNGHGGMDVGIGSVQRNWLASELNAAAAAGQCVVIFTHHLIGYRNPVNFPTPFGQLGRYWARDAEDVQAVIENSDMEPGKIVVFMGHHHPGAVSGELNGVRYWNVRGLILGDEDLSHLSHCIVGLDNGEDGPGAKGVFTVTIDRDNSPEFNFTDPNDFLTPQTMVHVKLPEYRV